MKSKIEEKILFAFETVCDEEGKETLIVTAGPFPKSTSRSTIYNVTYRMIEFLAEEIEEVK